MGLKVVVGREHAGTDELFLQGLHKVQQVLRLATADVVHGIRGDGQSIGPGLALGGALHHAYYSLNDVIHIRKVAAAVAVVVDLDGLSAEQLVGEPKVGHVGPSGGAIDGEEPQAGAGDVVEFAVAVGHELVALLGGGIQGDGVVHAVVGAEGHLLVAAIHATAAGINQMLHGMTPARLQDVVKPNDVALNVNVGVLDGVPHPGLCGQVDHNVKLVLPEQAVHQLAVGNATLHGHIVYARRFGTRQLPQAVLLERRIVIVVQVVNAHNRPFCHLTQQPTHKIAPNEPGMSGYKYSSHILLLLISSLPVDRIICLGVL